MTGSGPTAAIGALAPDVSAALRSADPTDALNRLADISGGLGDYQLGDQARELRERIADGRFYVACVGQFKRGKSTLINALIGGKILPTGIVPITTVPTVVRYGSAPAARLRLGDGPWQDIHLTALDSYVSEERNPQNAAGVTAIEVFAPSPLLRNGLCLVDTPGLGSVFGANTAATHAFVPHIDAALVVIGSDPPLSGDELTLVRAVAEQAPNLIVALNKADRADDAARHEAIRFADRVLTGALGRSPGPIYEVSAADRLAGHGPPRDWQALCLALGALSTQTGRTLVQAALSRGTIRLAEECLRQIDEASLALLRPLDESEHRLEALRCLVAEVGHRSLQLGHLFDAEQEALARTFAARRETFLARVTAELSGVLARAINGLPARRGPTLRHLAVRGAQSLARERLEPWLGGEQQAAEEAYRKTAAQFVGLANDFLARLATSPEFTSGPSPRTLAPEAGFRRLSRFTFHDLPVLVAATARGQWWFDQLRPPAAARRAVRRDTADYLRQLLEVNSTRVQNDLDERVLESRRHLQDEVQVVLRAAYESAGRAVTRAREAQAAGEEAVAAEAARLAELRREVVSLKDATPPDGGDAATPVGNRASVAGGGRPK